MNKDKFNKLEILEQIDFINSKIQYNNSITAVCKEIGVGRSTIRDRFKKANYSYSKNLNKYVYIEPTEVSKELENNNSRNTSVIYNKSNTSSAEDNPVLTVLEKSNKDFQNNIIDLVNNYDVLKEIIELHRCNTSVIKQQIIIDLDNSENKLTTLRVNTSILDKFNEFCKQNKQFTKVDLISQALKDFMESHS